LFVLLLETSITTVLKSSHTPSKIFAMLSEKSEAVKIIALILWVPVAVLGAFALAVSSVLHGEHPPNAL
jgi:hypothetical protein